MLRLLTLDCSDDLVGHVPDLVDRKGLEVVFFEEVERAQSKQFKHNAHVPVVVKPVKHTHTTAVTEKRNSALMISIRYAALPLSEGKRECSQAAVSYSELI